MTVDIVRVSTQADLDGILSLHKANLIKNLTKEEMELEGFVTVEFDAELLRIMHAISPSVIAKDGDMVVGYVLVITKELYGKHQLLDEMFNKMDAIQYGGGFMKDSEYVLIGQLCVDKAYRGQGIVQRMYSFKRSQLESRYACCCTNVAITNPRSLKAHIKSGFRVIKNTTYNGIEFDIIHWDWSVSE